MPHREHYHERAHGHGHDSERRVRWALLLTAGFMAVEVVGGIVSGSLALIADAGHMLTDTAALTLAYVAFRISRRPATPNRSYGHARAQVLVALVNGGALFGITAWIAVEAITRLARPVEILGGTMLAVAVASLAVNVAAFLVLHGGDRESLNMRGAALHVLSDILGSAAAILAAVVILTTGWTAADPLLSLLVAALIARGAWKLVSEAWHVLMEGTPAGLDTAALRQALAAVPGVADVHHVHAWSLVPGRTLLTLHAAIKPGADHDALLRRLQRVLAERFGIDHATIQVERGGCADRDAPQAASLRPG